MQQTIQQRTQLSVLHKRSSTIFCELLQSLMNQTCVTYSCKSSNNWSTRLVMLDINLTTESLWNTVISTRRVHVQRTVLTLVKRHQIPNYPNSARSNSTYVYAQSIQVFESEVLPCTQMNRVQHLDQVPAVVHVCPCELGVCLCVV